MRRSLLRLAVLLVLALLLAAAVAQVAGASTSVLDKYLLAKLGAKIYFDENLAEPAGQSCASCHHPKAGFAELDKDVPVSEGVILGVWGFKNSPTTSYTGWSPVLHYDEAKGAFVGGMNWDGGQTGLRTGLPLADQALNPFLAPFEMNNGFGPTGQALVVRDIQASSYADLFLRVFPGTDWTDVATTYTNVAYALAAYQASAWTSPFLSRFDLYRAGLRFALTSREKLGLKLFEGKGTCSTCHPSSPTKLSTGLARGKALFTAYTFENVGLPFNQTVAGLHANDPRPVVSGDLGLGNVIRRLQTPRPPQEPAFLELDATLQDGKFKVPTLRNVAKTAPYGHNGYFPTLYEMVHFLNTRAVPGAGWALPEVAANLSMQVGNLGLTYAEEQAIVAFLKTLTDPVIPQPAH